MTSTKNRQQRQQRLTNLRQRLASNRIVRLQSDDPEEFELMLELASEMGFDALQNTQLQAIATHVGDGKVQVTHIATLGRINPEATSTRQPASTETPTAEHAHAGPMTARPEAQAQPYAGPDWVYA